MSSREIIDLEGSEQGSGKSDEISSILHGKQNNHTVIHAWVKPFYSHLEVMDVAVNIRLKSLERKADNSNA